MTNARGVLQLAVLISGTGRHLANFVELTAAGRLPARIAVVISSRANAGGVSIARAAGLPLRIIRPAEVFDDRISAALNEHRVSLVCMAGFLSLWRIPQEFEGRVMNIHPALLPGFGGKGFYGHRVHEAVLASGATESGCTVHFADNEYDHGPIILQRRVPVLPGDTPETLAARVFEQELIAYPEAVRLFAAGRLRIDGDRVRVIADE